MITESQVSGVLYPPECIPDSWFGNVPLGAEVAPPIIDLRRFSPNIAILRNIQLTPNANVVLRARYDDIRLEENTAAMLADLAGAPLVGAWTFPAKQFLYYNLFGIALAPNYTTHYGMWVKQPTIADKLLHGITLTNSEKAICDELGIRNTVEKGLLPLPITQQVEREYHVMAEETHSRSVNIAVGATDYSIESIYPRNNEFVVLTKVAAAPAGVANDVRLVIDRDDNVPYAELRCFALSLVAGGEVDCFIPALKEIRLHTTATVAPGAHLFRYTYKRIRYTNILRCRFGLVSEDEVPTDTYKKVKAGVL